MTRSLGTRVAEHTLKDLFVDERAVKEENGRNIWFDLRGVGYRRRRDFVVPAGAPRRSLRGYVRHGWSKREGGIRPLGFVVGRFTMCPLHDDIGDANWRQHY